MSAELAFAAGIFALLASVLRFVAEIVSERRKSALRSRAYLEELSDRLAKMESMLEEQEASRKRMDTDRERAPAESRV